MVTDLVSHMIKVLKQYKKLFIIYSIIIVGMICVLIPIHEIGHYLFAKIFYGANGTIVFEFSHNYVAELFVDKEVGIYSFLGGGIFTSLVYVMPLFFRISKVIKVVCLALIIIQLSYALIEGFNVQNTWYYIGASLLTLLIILPIVIRETNKSMKVLDV